MSTSKIPESVRSNIEAMLAPLPSSSPRSIRTRDKRVIREQIGNDGIVTVFAQFRELLGIVRQSGGRYELTLRRLGVALGQCRRCWMGSPFEVVDDPEYGKVHVHREPRGEIREINANAVYGRDKWVCQICGGLINPRLKSPNKWSASVDHIVPKYLGGKDEATNLQAAHRRCNSIKSINSVPPPRRKATPVPLESWYVRP